ncbi:hypothetical protein HYN59_07190 [Flavobacterium album]|uniref:Uncharacterized protein n=1 Tax=Flavobacterium album TaxID=2175091 RepID=A0A2S1QX09_9FLAO|nr:hypothetical protein [Flavobacterium album]AWH84923.1 hypothetical protein HYN59_07190 [Flavobacterium album]
MEIILPENISEITLGKFIKYDELLQRDLDQQNFNRRKIALFTGIPFKDTARLRQADYDRLILKIDAALNTDAEFTDRFTMHGIEFGFIPDFDKITIGEFADLSQHGLSSETLHRLMAVLFRPVIKTIGSSYVIMPYDGTEEYAEMMKDMPLNAVNGALVFFYSLASELQAATQKYLTEELLRENPRPNFSRTSAGIRRLKNWLKTTFSRSRRSKN